VARSSRLIYLHPKIQECCVLGTDNPKRGKAIVAFVCPVSGQTLEKRDLMAFLKERLASYNLPQDFIFMETPS